MGTTYEAEMDVARLSTLTVNGVPLFNESLFATLQRDTWGQDRKRWP